MKYIVKLLEADVISQNNRCYSKEAVERINEQLNSNTVNIYGHNIYEVKDKNKVGSIDDIIGQTIKCSSRIENNILFVDVNLIKPVNANFINICCSGYINLSNKPKKDYNGNITAGLDGFSHEEVKEPDVVSLYNDNTNSYYDDSNIISQNNKLEIE